MVTYVNKIRVLKIIETLNQSWPTVRMILEYEKQTQIMITTFVRKKIRKKESTGN